MIGIGITTHNRRNVLEETLENFKKYFPDDAKIVVVDDGSDVPIPSLKILDMFRDISHEAEAHVFINPHGIAAAKNRCLKLLEECDHIFLFDDDTYPIKKGWELPYIESKEPHLMYQFRLPGKGRSDMREVYRDDKIAAFTNTRGCMIYVQKIVLDIVGGLNPAYGECMFEHPDWTNRIHNAGLTTHRAMDVVDSDKLIHCLDQDVRIESSIPPEKKKENIQKNFALYQKSKRSKEYKEFRI